jgi:type IV pilus assembly protein PilC
MATFAWEGLTRAGESRRGTIEADNEPEVHNRLRQQNITVTRLARRASLNLSFAALAQRFSTSATRKEIALFTRQLATMIDAGLPLVQSLDILAGQADRPPFARLLRDIKTTVEHGASFSEALKAHPRTFDELFTNLIAAGEAGGILDRILARLAGYIEKSIKLRSQIRGAMAYPIGILFVAIGVIALMLGKIIPVFEGLFREFNASAALPAPTRFVINLSHGFIDNFIFFAAGAAIFFFGGGYLLRTPGGRRAFDRVVLRVPLFGSLLRKVAVARFCRTLGTLLTAGVPILDALDIVAKSAGNVIVAEAIQKARLRISEGRSIAEPLGESGVFPSMVVQMIGVGEQTGAMDSMLQKIADFYEEEVDVAVGALTKLMEPAMMVFLGGIVGGLLIAMYMPIFELAGNVRAG